MRRLSFLMVMVLLAIPLFARHETDRAQSVTGTTDLLGELRGTDAATLEATSSNNLDDLRDADGNPFPQPVVDRGPLNYGQAVNEDPGTDRKSYLYHVGAKAGDHLSFSMIGSPKLQPILALLDSATGKALIIVVAKQGSVMALLDYDVTQDGSFVIVASYHADAYGTTSGAAFILTYTLFKGASGGMSVASGFVTPTDVPTATITPTVLPSDTPVPTITPRATLTPAPTVLASPTSANPILPNGIQSAGDIQAGDTKTGTLDDNTPFLAYRFQGRAGQHIFVTMDANRGLQPSLALAYGDGLELLTTVRPRNGETKIALAYDITKSGNYYIIATRVGADRGTSSGSYSLKLQISQIGSVQA